MKQPNRNTFDATYAARYTERNAEKVQRILSHLDQPNTLLDLGCNAGYVDAAVLEAFPNAHCHGVELEESVVDPDLKANPRFQLTVSDVVDFRFEQTYDAVIFNAVLHHVLGKYGKEAAFGLWTSIVDHTNHELFFETGIVAEAGEYYWKDAILREFGGDELYYSELIRRIGPRLKRMDVVAELPIHDAVRLLHRFELHPLNSEFDLKASPERVYQQGYLDDGTLDAVKEFRRTEGSRRQQLLAASETNPDEEGVFHGTQFFELRNTSTGDKLFAKRMGDDPLKQMREYQILTQVQHPRIINCLGVSQQFGLVFPFFAGKPLPEIEWGTVENADEVAAEISAFFDVCDTLTFEPGRLDIDPLSAETKRRLIDTIDLHANNFLVQQEGDRVTDWRLIDLEHFTNSNAPRNDKHRQQILATIRPPRKSWVKRLFSGN